ncbi:MAG TPA: HD-GYP domain-containing protein [Phycisphaerales bacterium]|nr:HD-GYP domain-containing protein [Phycisphaerales bacterium]
MPTRSRQVRYGSAPARIGIIGVIILAQVLVVGAGWWSGSRGVLTEVVENYSQMVETSLHDAASGIAIVISELNIDSIEPNTPGGERVRALIQNLDLPGGAGVSLVSNDGQTLYQSDNVRTVGSSYEAVVPLNQYDASLVIRAPVAGMESARNAATSAITLRAWLGGVIIISLTGVVGLILVSLHERRLIRANESLGSEIRNQTSTLLAAREGMIVGLAKLADYRDTDTGRHLDRICAYSALLAELARDAFPGRIDDDFIESLRLAASLHDIGKVGIPDAVLLKPGKLNPEERKLIEKHPQIGAETLDSIRTRYGHDVLLDMGYDIALSHHEWWDGTGYPQGLAGEEIPFAARIVSIVDVYDALTSSRVYKPAMTHSRALQIMEEGRGTQFDPTLLDIFLSHAGLFDQVRHDLQPSPLELPRNLAA